MRFAALATIALVLISGVALPQSLDEQVSQLLAENKPLEAASIAKQAIEQSTTNEGPEHPVTKNDSLSHQLFRSLHGLRDWKDRTGEYTITAHFIEMKDGNVRLLMPGGKTKVVALDKLSPADRQHVEQVAKMKAQLAASNLALPKPAAGDIQNPSGPVPTQNELPVKGLSGQARVATEAPQSPEAAILGFFSIPTIRWRERLPYVADIDLAEKYMAEIYGRVASRDVASNFAITSIGADRSSARAGDDLPFRCSYVMRGENDERVIFVTKTVDGFKVNWMRSYHPWLLQNTPEGVVYRWYVGQKTADRLLPLCANPDEAKLLINKYCDDPKYAGGPGGLSHADTHEPLPVTFFSDDYAKFLSNSSDPFRMLFITKENFEKKMAEQVWVVKRGDGYAIDFMKNWGSSLTQAGLAGKPAAPPQQNPAADVRNSNWGDSPDVVRQNQPEITNETSKDESLKELTGVTLIADKPFKITYYFFKDRLVRVTLLAAFNRSQIGSSNRERTWNPFAETSLLSVLLNEKYGMPTTYAYYLNMQKVGLLDAKDWPNRLPQEASSKQKWDVPQSTIELSGNSSITDSYDFRLCTLTYSTKEGVIADFESRQNTVIQNEYDERRRSQAKGL